MTPKQRRKMYKDDFDNRQWFEPDYSGELRSEVLWKGEVYPYRIPYGPSGLDVRGSAQEFAEKIRQGLAFYSYGGRDCVSTREILADRGCAIFVCEGGG